MGRGAWTGLLGPHRAAGKGHDLIPRNRMMVGCLVCHSELVRRSVRRNFSCGCEKGIKANLLIGSLRFPLPFCPGSLFFSPDEAF